MISSESRMPEIRTSGLMSGGVETRPRRGLRHRRKPPGTAALPASAAGRATLRLYSSFWSAVLDGRNRLFETMKRGGAGLLSAWSSHKVLTPCTAPSPAFVKVGDGNAISWLRYRKYWVTFACRFTPGDAAERAPRLMALVDDGEPALPLGKPQGGDAMRRPVVCLRQDRRRKRTTRSRFRRCWNQRIALLAGEIAH